MLELPESRVFARQMDELVRGKIILSVEVGRTPHKFFFTGGEEGRFARMLTGQEIGATTPLGIYQEIAAGPARLVIGEGMGLRLLAAEAPRPDKHQVLIELDSGQALMGRVQMYGGAWVHEAKAPVAEGRDDVRGNFYYQVAWEKPQPLTGGFSPAYFESLRAGAKGSLSMKAFLATEQRIPGLGNGVLQDILFRAKLHPKRKLAAVSDEEYGELYHALVNTLAAMDGEGGRDTEKNLLGEPGGYKTLLSAKTAGQLCPACGGAGAHGVIEKQNYLGGSIYFCPVCQVNTAVAP